MNIENRLLAGDTCKVAVYDGMMRFQVQGSYTSVPKDAEVKAEDSRMLIERFSDGSADVTIQSLIKWDTTDAEIEQMYDNALNRIETVLGIQDGCLSSSSWNAGYADQHWDALMTDTERQVVIEGAD